MLINKYTMTLVTGNFFYHQYFSFLTLLMFNSIDFSLPPSPQLCPHFAPYIENPAIAHGAFAPSFIWSRRPSPSFQQSQKKTSWNFWNISETFHKIFHEIIHGQKIMKFYITNHESWQNDICSFRAMTVALTVSFKLISF